jgi:hypothetical protein
MYLTESSQGWGEATLKPGPKSARGTMGAPFSDRPPVTDPRYVFSPAITEQEVHLRFGQLADQFVASLLAGVANQPALQDAAKKK